VEELDFWTEALENSLLDSVFGRDPRDEKAEVAHHRLKRAETAVLATVGHFVPTPATHAIAARRRSAASSSGRRGIPTSKAPARVQLSSSCEFLRPLTSSATSPPKAPLTAPAQWASDAYYAKPPASPLLPMRPRTPASTGLSILPPLTPETSTPNYLAGRAQRFSDEEVEHDAAGLPLPPRSSTAASYAASAALDALDPTLPVPEAAHPGPKWASALAGTVKARKAFGKLLDEVVPSLAPQQPTLTSVELRELFGQGLTRVIDFFRRADTDGSGEVNVEEFKQAVTRLVRIAAPTRSVRAEDVESIFRELDYDNSGVVSYGEMRVHMRPVAGASSSSPPSSVAPSVHGGDVFSSPCHSPLATGGKRAAVVLHTSLPQLPRELQCRSKAVLDLYAQFEKRQAGHRAQISAGNSTVHVDDFEQCLRLYYPNDPKAVTVVLLGWTEKISAAKVRAQRLSTRESDAALIAKLDTDGNGTISVAEFCELGKHTGLSPAKMRQKFREVDLGNTGELTAAQMHDVFHSLRDDMARHQEERAVTKAAPPMTPPPRTPLSLQQKLKEA